MADPEMLKGTFQDIAEKRGFLLPLEHPLVRF
jgi:hypothetical protein